MIKRIFSVIFTLIAIDIAMQAQDFVSSTRWFGDLRIRSEVDMRDFKRKTAANTYTLFRARLAFEAQPMQNVRILLQARDSRTFGTTAQLADARNLDLHQGYVEVKQFFNDKLTFRLGRQELSYANERIIGTVGWHNIGRVFDGGLLRYDEETYSLDLLAMNLNEVQPYQPVATPTAVAYIKDEGTDLYGGYLTLKNLSGHRLDGYLLYQWNRRQTTPGKIDLNRYTMGAYGKGKFGSVDYEAEAAYQFGKQVGVTVAASMVTATVGYGFAEGTLNRIAAGVEILTGTRAGSTKIRTFDPPFHTGHKFYGFMDYFIGIPANTANRGLVDLLGRATVALTPDLTANIWIHHFTLHEKLNNDKLLGQEVDLVGLYRYGKSLSFELGVSAFVPGPVVRARFGGGDVAFWGYLTTMVTF